MSEYGHEVRSAVSAEANRLLEIAQAAQNRLTRARSVQQIAGYSAHNICERTERGELFVLKVSGSIIGSAFVEPVTPVRFPQVSGWRAMPEGCPAWFLYGLVIHPEHQGRQWGQKLLHGICRQKKLPAPAVLLLDCWAGNARLRCFYADAGFDLHGVFPEEDYEVAVFRKTLNRKAPVKH